MHSSHRLASPRHRVRLSLLISFAIVVGLQSLSAAAGPDRESSPVSRGTPAGTRSSSIAFVPNAGQVDSTVRFVGYTTSAGRFFLTDREVVWAGPTASRSPVIDPAARVRPQVDDRRLSVVRWRLVGMAARPDVVAGDRLPGVINYLKGGDSAQWQRGLPTYASVVFREVYPGVDLEIRGRSGRLDRVYRIGPHVDPTRISWQYDGVDDIVLEPASGAARLMLPTSGHSDAPRGANLESIPQVMLRPPRAWQQVGARQVEVAVHYAWRGYDVVGLELGAYNPQLPLFVESSADYATYLGGSLNDLGNAIAVDGQGNAYVTGQTRSVDFPVVPGLQPQLTDGADAFVAKLDPSGSHLVYATYIGGSRDDAAEGIAVDATGSVYLTGWTNSSNFPTRTPIQSELAGGDDIFVLKLEPSGETLAYATYLGGSRDEFSDAVDIDATGHAYAGGWTRSEDFPTAQALQSENAGQQEAFVVKLQPTGEALAFATYLGGSQDDRVEDLAVDAAGLSYVAGWTASDDFPTQGAAQPTHAGGGHDAFVASLEANGSELRYATYIGGSGDDGGCGVAVDSSGSAYVSGDTGSPDFPVTNAFQPDYGGGLYDSFIVKVNPAGSALMYATYVGGDDMDFGYGMAVDDTGMAYVTGETQSRNFPTRNATQPANHGSWDVAVVKLDPAGGKQVYATYFGGNRTDFAYSIAVDPAHNIYVAGWTESTDLPTESALQPSTGGATDAFVLKVPYRMAAAESLYLPLLRRP